MTNNSTKVLKQLDTDLNYLNLMISKKVFWMHNIYPIIENLLCYEKLAL